MPTIILSHRVKDFESWKKAYDADRPRRDSAGLREIVVSQKRDEPDMAYMIWDTADTSVIEAMFADKDLQQTMQDAGVVSKPEVVVLS